MSCLLNKDQRQALRALVYKSIKLDVESGKKPDVIELAKKMYDRILKSVGEEASDTALDAARLVPLFVYELTALDSGVRKSLDREFKRDLPDVLDSFESNLENVREALGLPKSPAEQLKEAEQEEEEKKAQEEEIEIIDTPVDRAEDLPLNPLQTYGAEVDEAGEEVPKRKRVNNILKRIAKVLKDFFSQGVEDSRQVSLPNVSGGLFVRLMSAPQLAKRFEETLINDGYETSNRGKLWLEKSAEHKNKLFVVITDNQGRPIPFNAEGTPDANGKIAYYELADNPPAKADGTVITDEKEFNDWVSKNIPEKLKGAVAAGWKKKQRILFDNVKKEINNKLDSLELETKEEREEARQDIINEVSEKWKQLAEIRKQVVANPTQKVLGAISSASTGFVEKNVFAKNNLSTIEFEGGFNPYVVKEDNNGWVYLDVEGISQPIRIEAPTFKSLPEIKDKVITLLTEPLYTEILGEMEPMSIDERVRLLDQFLLSSLTNVRIPSYEKDGVRAYISERKGVKYYTVKVGSEKFFLPVEGQELSNEDIKYYSEQKTKAKEALNRHLDKGVIYRNDDGSAKDQTWKSAETRKKAGIKDIDLQYSSKIGEQGYETLPEGSIFVMDTKIVDGKVEKLEKKDWQYFYVYGHRLNTKAGLLNKKLEMPEFTLREDGTYEVRTTEQNYNEFIKAYWKTAAKVNDQNRIQEVNPQISIQPLLTALNNTSNLKTKESKQVKEKKKKEKKPEPKPEVPAVHESFKGKFVWFTPGSGKASYAEAIEDAIDADVLIVDAIREKYPDIYNAVITEIENDPERNLDNPTIIYLSRGKIGSTKAIKELYDEVYNNVIKNLLKEGKTVLTANDQFVEKTDIHFKQTNEKNWKDSIDEKKVNHAAKTASKAGVPVVEINSRVADILSKPLPQTTLEATEDTSILRYEDGTFDVLHYEDGIIGDRIPTYQEALKLAKEYVPESQQEETVEEKNEPATQEQPQDESEDEFFDGIDDFIGSIQKNARLKAEEVRASKEQIKAAYEWYKKHPLSKHFPFRTLVAAVNTSRGGAAAEWAVNGIILYHYYDEKGNFDPSISGDYSDLYHEAFHGFTQTFLTQEQREALYDEVRKKQGSFVDYKGNYVLFSEATAWQIEEFLAEDFRKYMMSGGKATDKNAPVKNGLFRKILNFLKQLFGISSTTDVISNPLGHNMINEIYEKLRVGDLSSYNFDVNNRDKTIGTLHKSIVATNEETELQELGYEDSMLLVRTVDSIISRKINELNTSSGSVAGTTAIMKDKKWALQMYKYVKNHFENTIIPRLEKRKAAAQDKYQQDKADQLIKLVTWAINEFGNLDSLSANSDGKGLIYYHLEKSKYLAPDERDYLLDDINETDQNVKARSNYERSGNESSSQDLADPEIHYILRSLHKYDNKKPVENELGEQEMEEFHIVWNKLGRILQDSASSQEMYNRLVNEAKKDKTIDELIKKIGAPIQDKITTTNVWIKFWQTFNLAKIPLIQMNIERSEGEYIVKIGSANSSNKKVGRQWENIFNAYTTEYIKRDPNTYSTYLDVAKVINDFGTKDAKGKLTLKPEDRFNFLRAVGIRLSNKQDIINAVNKENVGKAKYLFDKLVAMHDKGIVPKSLKDVIKEVKENGKVIVKGEDKNYNDLMQLETRHADYVSSDMVTNAEGNTQFERSLNNTISVVVKAINKANNYAELIALPHMKHLDIDTNPFARKSQWLRDIFDLDNYQKGNPAKKGSKRRIDAEIDSPFVELELNNLSGAQMIIGRDSDGIASSKADEFTKLVLDFHLTLNGNPELMRHADKGTSFSVSVGNRVIYIDTKNFAGRVGTQYFVNHLVEYLGAELDRINILTELAKKSKKETIIYDAHYLNQGQKFIIFESILSEKSKAALKKIKVDNTKTFKTQLEEENKELYSKIQKEIASYFDKQVEDVTSLINKGKFISPVLRERTKVEARVGSNQQAEEILIKSFVANNWIHHIESMSVLYGDIAMYNHAKEEFHKRNAGAGSTGKLFANDPETIRWVNQRGRLYAKSQGIAEKKMSESGAYDTAVLEDNEIPSVYLERLAKGLIRAEIKKKLSENDAKKKVYGFDEKTGKIGTVKKPYKNGSLFPYTELNEGDAQGWITFDFYRVLSNLEGEWSPQQEKLYRKAVKGEEISLEEAATFFPTKKFQYWGAMQVGEGQLPLNAFHKFSLFPLIPNVVKGTNLEQLHKKMMEQEIDYALFESGSKVSTISKVKFNEEKNKAESIKDKFYSDKEAHTFMSEGDFVKNTLFVQYLKDQLYIAPKYKGQVTFPTQMRKLIENGMMEGGVPTDFMSDEASLTVREAEWKKLSSKEKEAKSRKWRLILQYEEDIKLLTELKKEELIKEAGIQREDPNDPNSPIIFNEKLKKFLIREMTRQDLADHEIAFLKEGPGGKLAHDLSISLSAEKLEQILNSIVVKRLIRQKFKGEGLIQVSGAGFEKTLRGELTEEEKAKYGTDGLAFYEQPEDIDITKEVNVKLRGGKEEANEIITGKKTSLLKGSTKDFGLELNESGIATIGGKPFVITYEGLQTEEEVEEGKKPKHKYSLRRYSTNTRAMKVKIALQGDFENLLYLKHTDGETIGTLERLNEMLRSEEWLNTANHRDMISVIGPRIPVQGLNSMEFAEVAEFLPKEAGNIIVLPSEIVAKSGGDFDIDKLTFMFSNIRVRPDIGYWKTKEGREQLESLKETYAGTAVDFSDENIKAVLERKEKLNENQKEVRDILYNQAPKRVIRKTDNKSKEGLENRIIDNMRSILELEDNFADLIRPNDTNIVKPIADELSDKVTEVDFKTVEEDGKKRIAGTSVFEVRYNLYKHSSNNIGKQTLGLGAVDNTYNSILNRIGARMNHSYEHSTKNASVLKRLTILLQHNTLKDSMGNDVISLSHLTDASENPNMISDVISQLMNGWVDIAKDAWIFNLQGNKEISPTLLFMIQAGVPVEQAVYFVSHPLVREYVKQQKLYKSTFADVMGKSIKNKLFFRLEARKNVLANAAADAGIDELNMEVLSSKKAMEAIYNATMDLTSRGENEVGRHPDLGTSLDFFDPNEVTKNLKERIDAYSSAEKAGKLHEFKYNADDVAVFLHFIELEEMSKSLTNLKLKTNFDTTRSNTTFEAVDRLEAVEELKTDGKIPSEIVDQIIKESPIGSFFIQEFQINLWNGLFKLRNNEMLNDFIISKTRNPNFLEDVKDVFGEGQSEKFIKEFRNDIVSYMFQNYLKRFDLDEVLASGYKGIGINEDIKVIPVASLANGVFVKEHEGQVTFFVNKEQLERDYLELSTSQTEKGRTIQLKDGTVVKLASINPAAFQTKDEYMSFVFEREMLRFMYRKEAAGWDRLQEREDVKEKLKSYTETTPRIKGESETKFKARVETLVFEETIRDMALDNVFNTWKMFNSTKSMADQLTEIKALYPDLAKTYSIVNFLGSSISEDPNGNNRIANIILNEMMLDSDKINIFNENLLQLRDPSRIKIDSTSKEERQRVADFFNRLSMYAFLQSGLNTKGQYALTRIVPQDRIVKLMVPFLADFNKNLNPLSLSKYYESFKQVNKSPNRFRYKDYITSNFDPQEDSRLSREEEAPTEPVTEGRLETTGTGVSLFYGNPTLEKELKGLTVAEAKLLLEENADKLFVINGAIEKTGGATNNEEALYGAKQDGAKGNVLSFPAKNSFRVNIFTRDGAIVDVTIEQAQELSKTLKPEEVLESPTEAEIGVDDYKYFGKMYKIKTLNGKGVDVENYKGKAAKKQNLLNSYNTNPNVDPQNGKPFRSGAVSKTSTDLTGEKEVVVPKGSNPNNLPIFATEDKIYLMNDGQQKAYDTLKGFILDRLNKRGSSQTPVVFDTELSNLFSGLIPQDMWDNMIGLQGRGGVGKTTVIKKVLEDVIRELGPWNEPRIIYAAPTHNAVTMLQEALGLDTESTKGVKTTASLVKRNQSSTSENREKTEAFKGENALYLLSDEAYEEMLDHEFRPIDPISKAGIIIIDEASMLDKTFIEDLLRRFKSERETGKSDNMPVFVFMGDYRQLPPVITGAKEAFQEGVISATLFNDPKKFVELTQVMRSDNQFFHDIFDTIGNQITEQRKKIEKGEDPKNLKLDFTEYDELTKGSTENLLVAQERQLDAIIDMYATELARSNDPYEMYWTHYNNLKHPSTKALFNKIREKYFEKIGQKVKGDEVQKGDYVEYTGAEPVQSSSRPDLGISKGIIKPRSRYKVLDVSQEEVGLRDISSTLSNALRQTEDIKLNVKVYTLYNRNGNKRAIHALANPNDIKNLGYNKETKKVIFKVKDTEGKEYTIGIPYGVYKKNKAGLDNLSKSFEKSYELSYIGSTHTVQGASIKKIIVGDYNIRENLAKGVALRDIESSLYTGLTRTKQKLIIIKPNNIDITPNQREFKLLDSTTEQNTESIQDQDGVAKTSEEALDNLKSGAPQVTHVTTPKNVFTVEPIQDADKKAKSKAKIATQYIGFGEGISGSSTASYAEQAGQYANTGNYSSNDVIFVSVPGRRGNKAIRKQQQDKTIKEAIKAIEAGATIITDNKKYIDSSPYNEGEKRLYDAMLNAGYNYSEITVDGQTLGTWSKPTTQPQVVVEGPVVNGKTINPVIKQKIDAAIQSMKEYQKAGYEITFPGNGIGQYMIGADDQTGIFDPTRPAMAPVTFLYLSKQLFENFGYVNKNFEKVLSDQGEINVVQEEQIVSDEDVMEAIGFCFFGI